MDESALRIALTSLDTSWSSLEHLLWVCAFVVFAGVALEIVPIVWEYRLERHDFWRGITDSPENPSKLKFSLELVGAALVALGVFGELAVGIKMARVETDMRDKTAALVSVVGQRASDANLKAEGLTKDNIKLKGDLDKAVARTNLQTEQLRAQNNATEAQLEQARSRVVELEKELEWRELKPSQSNAICAALRKFAGTNITINFLAGDAEGAEYADEFAETLNSKDCGWHARAASIVTFSSGPVSIVPQGLRIEVRDIAANPAAATFQSTLKALDISAPGEINSSVAPEDVFALLVGAKPRIKANANANKTQPQK